MMDIDAMIKMFPNDAEFGRAVKKIRSVLKRSNQFPSLKKKELVKIYLAIPYSGMEESSYNQATYASVRLLEEGYNVFSPITHSHPMSTYPENELPGTWDFWKEIDYQFLDWADELWVLVPWQGRFLIEQSTGCKAEIQYAAQNLKPITYFCIKNGAITVLND